LLYVLSNYYTAVRLSMNDLKNIGFFINLI
jgi:hypothetical protein